MIIRENQVQYMKQLRDWLADTAEEEPEAMADFFAARISGYEEHMAVWSQAYRRFAGLLPSTCRHVLDLGCGTGLELDEIFRIRPDLTVTGVDLCAPMLEKLREKHSNRNLTLICGNYFTFDMGKEKWDGVISFESLHHFLPDQKAKLYRKIYDALKPGGLFLLGDYMACCTQEEELLRQACEERRRKAGIPEDTFIHFDIPLTPEHETALLQGAGFGTVSPVECIAGAVLLTAVK